MKGIIEIVLLSALIHCAAALECYECSDCTVPFSSYFADTVECNSASCMKMNLTTKFNKLGIVSRGCSTYGFEAERCELTEVSGTTSEICYCNEDECNGTNDIKTTVTLIVVLSTIMILLFF
ncbi:uncharacterized protein LOC123555375 [Mercenaria mercenaria]|uniref:uncharacterized protein LOC123555375 n=1 Tax=Mercenaria mercenaria TaxID=6596 RepID=UPI00234EE4F5|nr:uncharacterized protein LOC123555375 [Mercenaria mercenaria]